MFHREVEQAHYICFNKIRAVSPPPPTAACDLPRHKPALLFSIKHAIHDIEGEHTLNLLRSQRGHWIP